MRKLFFSLALVVIVAAVDAAEKVHVMIKGMTCIVCAQGLKSTFKKQKAVDNVKLDGKERTMTLTLKDGAILDDKKISRIVTNGGYKVEKIQRVFDQ